MLTFLKRTSSTITHKKLYHSMLHIVFPIEYFCEKCRLSIDFMTK